MMASPAAAGAISVSSPNADYSFLGPSLPAGFTLTRASVASYFDSAGILQSAAVDAPRFDYNPANLAARGLLLEEARTNAIRNNTMVGASAGTPGTPPTNWFVTNNAGLTVQLVGTGTETGIPYVDYRFSGTAGAGGQMVGLNFEATTGGVSAATAQQWAASTYVKLAGGTLANITSMNLEVDEYTSIGGFVTSGTGVVTNPTASGLATQRRTFVYTTTGGGTVAGIVPTLRFIMAAAAATDFTIRIGLPQLEFGSTMTSVMPTAGSAVTRAADACARAHTISGYPVSYYVEGMEPVIQVPIAGFLTIDDGTTVNRLFFREQAGFNLFNAGSYNAGVLQGANPTTGSANAGSTWKSATMFNTSSVRGSMNGGAVIGAAGGTLPAAGLLNTMRLGAGQINGLYANGYLRRVQFWQGGLSDTQLVQAST
jgi:hypothetical protein